MSKAYMPLLLCVSLFLIVVTRFGFIFLLLALLPSVVAYFVDNHQGRPIFKTVLACNFTGTLPALIPMIEAGLKFQYQDLGVSMTNPKVWLFIYGGAAAGWGLIYLCNFIAHFILIIVYEYRIASLERFQKKLIEEWGAQVTGIPTAPTQ